MEIYNPLLGPTYHLTIVVVRAKHLFLKTIKCLLLLMNIIEYQTHKLNISLTLLHSISYGQHPKAKPDMGGASLEFYSHNRRSHSAPLLSSKDSTLESTISINDGIQTLVKSLGGKYCMWVGLLRCYRNNRTCEDQSYGYGL